MVSRSNARALDAALRELLTLDATSVTIPSRAFAARTNLLGRGFHRAVEIELERVDADATCVGVRLDLPRGLFYDADELARASEDGWTCVASGDVDSERAASRAEGASAACARMVGEDESTFSWAGALSLRAHARYGEPAHGGGTVVWDIPPARAVVFARGGERRSAAVSGGGTWEVPVGDASAATRVRAATDASVVLGALAVLLAVSARRRAGVGSGSPARGSGARARARSTRARST